MMLDDHNCTCHMQKTLECSYAYMGIQDFVLNFYSKKFQVQLSSIGL